VFFFSVETADYEEVKFAMDSPLEGAVHCELVSETRTQIRC